LSGLAAAVRLASRGAGVVLCEQAPRLGGRCYSFIDPGTGDIVDNGQHILLGAYHHLLEYLDTIGSRGFLRIHPPTLPLHHPEKGFASFSIPAVPRPFDLPAGMLKFTLLTLGERKRLLGVGLALRKWSRTAEEHLSALTVEQWLTRLGQSRRAMECLWNPISISVMNESPEKASALLFARTLRAAFLGRKSDSAILLPTVGQTELYVSGAIRYLGERNARIMENTEVASLEVRNSALSHVVLKDGRRLDAGCVIAAVPYYSLERIIPANLRAEQAFRGLGRLDSSPIVSLHLWFDREFMETDFLGLIARRIQWVFNRRRITGGEGKMPGYLSAVISGAGRFVDLPREKLVSIALEDLREVYPGMGNLLSSVVIKEKRATFSPTCEAEEWRPPSHTPVRNLFLAGDWTDTGLPATIEGAVQSGWKAADLIV
jgi:zeta-carotene desaturase